MSIDQPPAWPKNAALRIRGEKLEAFVRRVRAQAPEGVAFDGYTSDYDWIVDFVVTTGEGEKMLRWGQRIGDGTYAVTQELLDHLEPDLVKWMQQCEEKANA